MRVPTSFFTWGCAVRSNAARWPTRWPRATGASSPTWHNTGSRRRARYAQEPLAHDLQQAVYALDASVIDLCLSVYPWARFDAQRSGVKIHTQLEVHSSLPAQLLVSLATFQEVLWLDQVCYEPGAFYLMDRGYLSWARLYAIEQARAWFVVRAKKSLR